MHGVILINYDPMKLIIFCIKLHCHYEYRSLRFKNGTIQQISDKKIQFSFSDMMSMVCM